MTRLQQLRDRKGEIERELAGGPTDDPSAVDGDFDNEGWLVCEHEALKLELRRVKRMEGVEGGVDYE